MALMNPVEISVPDSVVWIERDDYIVDQSKDMYDYRDEIKRYEEERQRYESQLLEYQERIKEEQELRKRLLMNYSESPLMLMNENKGTLVYKIDEVLIIGVVSRVEARIIKQVGEETTEHLISLTTHTSTGAIYEEIIKVGKIMDMDLKSVDPTAFTINKIKDEEQLVDENDVTYWLWSVTANKVGSYNLIMTAKIKDNEPTRDIIIFDREINVMNKPKKKYSVIFKFPEEIKKYDESIIEIDVSETNSDSYSFLWGGEGKVIIMFKDKVTVISSEDNIINDKKQEFNYRWVIKPEGKEKRIPFNIIIVGDYENEIIPDGYFIVKKNTKESFNRFIDGAVKRWYWLFTALLIPIFGYIRKKYFKKKSD